MKVTFPRVEKLEEIEEVLERLQYKKIGKTEGKLTYEGVFPFGIQRQALRLPSRKFRQFYRNLKVEGGTKRLDGNWITIVPFADKGVYFKMSKDEYGVFKKYLREQGVSASEYLRLAIRRELSEWLEIKRKKETVAELGYA